MDAPADAATVDAEAVGAPEGGGSFPRRLLQALAFTVLAVALVEYLAIAGIRDTGAYRIVGLLVLPSFGFLLAAVFSLRITDREPSALGLGLPPCRGIAIWLIVTGSAALAAFALGVRALAGLAGVDPVPGSSVDPWAASRASLVLVFVAAVFVAPPLEELFFRGVVQGHLRGAASARVAVSVAGALFALVHVPNYLLVASAEGVVLASGTVLVVGLAIGLAYERTRSLPVAIGLHAGYNGLVLLTAGLPFVP